MEEIMSTSNSTSLETPDFTTEIGTLDAYIKMANAFKESLVATKKLQLELADVKAENKKMKPKADYLDRFITCDNNVTFDAAMKILRVIDPKGRKVIGAPTGYALLTNNVKYVENSKTVHVDTAILPYVQVFEKVPEKIRNRFGKYVIPGRVIVKDGKSVVNNTNAAYKPLVKYSKYFNYWVTTDHGRDGRLYLNSHLRVLPSGIILLQRQFKRLGLIVCGNIDEGIK